MITTTTVGIQFVSPLSGNGWIVRIHDPHDWGCVDDQEARHLPQLPAETATETCAAVNRRARELAGDRYIESGELFQAWREVVRHGLLGGEALDTPHAIPPLPPDQATAAEADGDDVSERREDRHHG